MNLNILTQLMNNFQEINAIKGRQSNDTDFKMFFEDLEKIGEKNEDEVDGEEIINYDIFQYMFDNSRIIDLKQFINLENINANEKNISLNLEQLNTQFENKPYLLNEIRNLLKSSKFDEFISQNIENGSSNNQSIDNEELLKLKEILDKAVNVEETSSFEAKDLRNKIESVDSSLNILSSNLEGYGELEASSLLNKNNLKDVNIEDKELNTLESILDSTDNSNFMLFNNSSSSKGLENISEASIKEVPVSNIRQEFISEDIIKTVKYLKSNGMEEIKIKISPRELGDMTIKLIKNPEETKILITISKEDVFNIVNKNIGDITKHLNDLNINVKEISVDIKNDNQKFLSDNLNQEFNKQNQGNKKKKNNYNNSRFENIEEIKENDKLEENINILI